MREFNFYVIFFFFSSRRRHTRFDCDWSSDVCSSDLAPPAGKCLVRLERAGVIAPRAYLGERAHRRRRLPVRVVEIGRASCRESVDLGGRRIIKKKKKREKKA